MYLPPAFREDDARAHHELVRAHPLGMVVTAGAKGLLANPIPCVHYPDEGTHGTLRLHMARANEQWRELAAVSECLVVFTGPQSYVTPGWYPTKEATGRVVPTWNYATVHAWGVPRVVEDTGWLRRQLDDLTLLQEGARPRPWSVADAPEDFIAAQIRGIVGVEIVVTRVEGKWKVSQNQPAENRAGVVAGLRAEGSDAMAELVARHPDPARSPRRAP